MDISGFNHQYNNNIVFANFEKSLASKFTQQALSLSKWTMKTLGKAVKYDQSLKKTP